MNPLYPIEWAVAWIMVKFHALLGLVMDPNSGWTWMLSIVGLTVVVRVIITPLFIRQIRSSRAMQAVSPQLQALQKKYKGKTDPESRQKMATEMQAVYKEAGASPLSSCLPLLLQMPIFFALFRVLFYKLPEAAGGAAFGPLTVDLAKSAYHATLLGSTTIADSFLKTGDGGITSKIVAGVIIALMCLTTFITQKELTMRNMPPSALEGPMASTQKMMMYMLPFIYVITGPGMPIGVLMYWLTTSLWTLAQQLIVVLTYPTPGSPAEASRHRRINDKRERKGLEPLDFTPKKPAVVVEEESAPIRVQPKKASGGKKLSDQERLEQARAAREKAQADRRAAQEARAAEEKDKPSSGSALSKKNQGGKKRRK
ncbi:membrane protein insertase YidC [Brachybacterium sp. NBEC-018]|uniref:membrane protein insertase YidC n=1 Tax=Brachybacterium sp. NBEC-018 TaxID=2996004 RepID=UPI00217559B8|nr:membrane protein insertase YidC [Brachybacterium sp. NBEC-018]UVY84596.1 membrane protein insertase YidC [Brachybacterium sp. NBEC-018]